jgi:osmotically-inducible protein OsmY
MTRQIPALIAVAALTTSCATPPPPATGSAGAQQTLSDELLAGAIASRLNADPTYYFRHVNVEVDHGVANLTGYVWSTDALYGARRIAGSVPGVRQVLTTQLELERNGRASGVAR